MYRLTPKEEISARIRALQERLGGDGGAAAGPKDSLSYLERKKVSLGVMGFGLDVMPVATFQRFSRLFPEAKPVDLSGAVREGRAVKGVSESDAMGAGGRKVAV